METTRKEILNKYISELQKYNPKYNVQFKYDSLYMKTLSVILFFNKKFLTQYTTTIGNTVYLGKADFFEQDNHIANPLATLSHEYVHIKDSKKYNILYYLGYLMPAVLFLLILPAAFIIGYWSLLFLLFLLPLPSIGRTIIEFRAYTMNLFVAHYFMKKDGVPSSEFKERLTGLADKTERLNFHSAAYYFMWPFDISHYFDKKIDEILSGDILNQETFREIQTALDNTIT